HGQCPQRRDPRRRCHNAPRFATPPQERCDPPSGPPVNRCSGCGLRRGGQILAGECQGEIMLLQGPCIRTSAMGEIRWDDSGLFLTMSVKMRPHYIRLHLKVELGARRRARRLCLPAYRRVRYNGSIGDTEGKATAPEGRTSMDLSGKTAIVTGSA